MKTDTPVRIDTEPIGEVAAIELETMQYSLADALREGAGMVEQTRNSWGDGVTNACALTTAVVAAQKRGYIKT